MEKVYRTKPNYAPIRMGKKKMSERLMKRVEGEIKALLHASRDCLRNRGVDTNKISFSCNDGYHGEAFGIMRTLSIQGYGYFGSNNLDGNKEEGLQPEQNLKWWFDQLQGEVLEEENFGKGGRCE